jgi:hypothetical protein
MVGLDISVIVLEDDLKETLVGLNIGAPTWMSIRLACYKYSEHQTSCLMINSMLINIGRFQMHLRTT